MLKLPDTSLCKKPMNKKQTKQKKKQEINKQKKARRSAEKMALMEDPKKFW